MRAHDELARCTVVLWLILPASRCVYEDCSDFSSVLFFYEAPNLWSDLSLALENIHAGGFPGPPCFGRTITSRTIRFEICLAGFLTGAELFTRPTSIVFL